MADEPQLNIAPAAPRPVSRRQLLFGTGGPSGPRTAAGAGASKTPAAPSAFNPAASAPAAQHPRGRMQGKRSADDEFSGESRRPSLKRSRVGRGEALPPREVGDGMATSLFSRVTIPRLQKISRSDAPMGPSNAPTTGPVTFETLGLHPLLVQHLKGPKMNIGERPTDIQKRALTYLLPQGRYSLDGEDDPDLGKPRRDVLMASQTGSGKSLAFLLPILDSLLPLSSLSFIDRSVGGCLAIILTPTRELARQIYEVLEKLVNLPLRLHTPSEEAQDDGPRMSRWIVPTLLCGGSTKNHEKQRLRKGSTIVVATPGRLLDHLQNTAAFEVGKLRWLVLDEADRLMELGFKESLEGIFRALEGRRKLSLAGAKADAVAAEKMPDDGNPKPSAEDEDKLDHMGVRWWAGGRRTVLCSATIDEDIQALAGQALKNPIVIRGHGGKDEEAVKPVATGGPELAPRESSKQEQTIAERHFTAPAQLLQNSVLVPPKLRLVTLIALLRESIYNQKGALKAPTDGPQRIIVFMSCTDSVDFHWLGVGGFKMGDAGLEEPEEDETVKNERKVFLTNQLLPGMAFYRLHGSMSQNERIASLKSFASSKPVITEGENGVADSHKASVLFCTSVASRGLDLPSVSTVIQLDAPTEGGVEEYVHRIGRTARVGRQGKSYIMLLPHEAPIARRYQDGMIVDTPKKTHPTIEAVDFRDVLKAGFGGKDDEYEARATDVQLAWERWVLRSEVAADHARAAFQAHLRAYATHPVSEKAIFSLRDVHLGHIAKAFALREAPATIKAKAKKHAAEVAAVEAAETRDRRKGRRAEAASEPAEGAADSASDSDSDDDSNADADEGRAEIQPKGKTATMDRMLALAQAAGANASRKHSSGGSKLKGKGKDQSAEARMYAAVRHLGKRSKKQGKLVASGVDDFQIA